MLDSIILLVAFSIFYIFIIEIFTVLFRITGISEDKARFQVISLLTACGFTTSQSEAITISKRRRRLASITMIFGYIFSLIIVSVVVNVFLHMSSSETNTFVGIGITLSTAFLVIFLLIKSKKAKIYFDSFINKIYLKLSQKKSNNLIIMDIFGNKIMANIHITVLPDFLVDTPLKNSGMKQAYGIQILIIKRDGEVLERIDGETQLRVNDDVVIFGKEKDITNLFKLKEN